MRRLLDGRSRLDFPPRWWKVKREIFRVGRQIDEFIFKYTGRAPSYFYLTLYVTPSVVRKKGSLPLGDRVAIYMIYPAQGLSKSHILALEYLNKCGYTPVVVSNLKLSKADQATVLQHSAALLVRPNYGYDFAAYRDSLAYLSPHFDQISYLAIFNDSTWFPIHPEHNWLHEAEAKNCDFVGSVFHCAIDPDATWDFRIDPWKINTEFPDFHYGSYSLLLSGNVTRSPQFGQFWAKYRPSNDKTKTIIGGEIGLSKIIKETGFTHAATNSTADLDRLLDTLPDARLRELATNLIIPSYPKMNQQRQELLANNPTNTDLKNFILKAVVKQGPGYALADLDLRDRAGNFLKKSPVVLDRLAARQTLQLLNRLDTPEAKVFAEEAKAMYLKKFGADLIP